MQRNFRGISMTEETWTPEDEVKLKELRRRKARVLRDPNRKHQYAPRNRYSKR